MSPVRPALIIRKTSPVVAICLSDCHLSIKPPIARADEPNWFAAMGRPWQEIHNLIKQHTKDGNAPVVLCGGDIFDKWNSPPELINWAIEHLPVLHSCPGNHDLPNHRPELVHRSAYGTLVRAGKIIELDSVAKRLYNLDVCGRPFGEEIPIPTPPDSGIVKVLVTHEYLWTAGTGHVGAPEECKLASVAKNFAEFDVCVVGDNHVGFERQLKSGTYVFNCGGLMRRKSNEAEYTPRVGLLRADGTVSIHHLNQDDDVLTKTITPEQEEEDEVDGDIDAFVENLATLEASDLSFRDEIIRVMDAKKVNQTTRETLLGAMGE